MYKAPQTPLGAHGDVDKAGWLKNKHMKLRLAECQPSQAQGVGVLQCPPPSRAMGNLNLLSLNQYIPVKGAHPWWDGEDGGTQIPMGYLSPCSSAHPQRFQVMLGRGWPPAVQFSRSSWPLPKRWGLASTITHGASAWGWRRAQPSGAITTHSWGEASPGPEWGKTYPR